MAELKTKPNANGVEEFLNKVENDRKRKDSFELLEMIEKATGEKAIMWGSSIVGAGTYHYKYASGQEGDWMQTGFSPRKTSLSIYIMGYLENYKDLLAKLGKHKTGKACLYVNKLDDIDRDVLFELIKKSAEDVKKANS